MSYRHAPEGYCCPFCQVAAGQTEPYTQPADVVYQDRRVTAFIASHWWPNNPGHVLIIPNEHYENIYDLPFREAARIQMVAQKIALAFKTAYDCAGVSTRQHNEPAGYQEVWHYHLHVFPRYADDNLYGSNRIGPISPDERRPYADKLKAYFAHLNA